MTLNTNEIEAIVNGKHDNPFSVLGVQKEENAYIARTFIMGAEQVTAFDAKGIELGDLKPIHPEGLFEGKIKVKGPQPITYRARALGTEWLVTDPYTFAPVLGPIDDYLIAEGSHKRLFDVMGAQAIHHQGVDGVNFAVWAPNAAIVAIVGDFNDWDARKHVMRYRLDIGVWEIFIPHIGLGRAYKFSIHDKAGNQLPLKADPFAFASELRPSTASLTTSKPEFVWNDDWHRNHWRNSNPSELPISIYEVQAGSWRKGWQGEFLNWDELSETLLPYVIEMGFTHIEFLPISEYPLDESWGYQTTGLYSPSARFGTKEALARFIDKAHQSGIGVIIDWVPAHFPSDNHGLSNFDGTALYEHADPRLGFHPDWTTFIYNFGRREVVSYLVNNALFWAEKYHVDGLRVDAVASMLYRDYSRKAGEWLPNSEGGRENWEAVEFLKRTNGELRNLGLNTLTIAEESTSWAGVTHNEGRTGLGFGFKWNMGFMNDTLRYMARDPIHRQYHHNEITFGLMYAFSENFVLPLSHDEVVHGKGSLLNKMAGSWEQKFQTLRAYYAFMWGYPGKKLLFMGQEFAQVREWSEARALDWDLLQYESHKGIQTFVRDLNNLYKSRPALHSRDCRPDGFEWLVVDDNKNSVFAWLRFAENQNPIAVICNFSGQTLHNYAIHLPYGGEWQEILNSDSKIYNGYGSGNMGKIQVVNNQAEITIPALSTIYIEYSGG
ncbi:1,4-alpha-glucan branching protein GlgB [Pseudaquidulcibacter saccharophilus]|uniref:1,4-alpha-glucan branching protein GlgB n=1 Tax=Pseudaquidulcibacter saccharophilus TaxID=2831900 RepID=UPI001EFF4F85|nr:1,4-alpha-glucan branching protein GlgB [Pseudaquidulcibacter saccharophilus]